MSPYSEVYPNTSKIYNPQIEKVQGINLSKQTGGSTTVIDAYYHDPYYLLLLSEVKTDGSSRDYLSVKKQVGTIFYNALELQLTVVSTEVYKEAATDMLYSYSIANY